MNTVNADDTYTRFGGDDANFQEGNALFNSQLTDDAVTGVATLTNGYYMPFVADLDNDGVNEIIVNDNNDIKLFQGTTLTPLLSYNVNISGNQFIIQILPYYIYNYNEIEHLYDYSKAKIVHIFYRGVRKLPQLIFEYKLNYFFTKFLKIFPKSIRRRINYLQNINVIASFFVQPDKIKKTFKFLNKKKIELLAERKKIRKLFSFIKSF